jgi:hypothetical protein
VAFSIRFKISHSFDVEVAAPIALVPAFFEIPMETGPRPIYRQLYEAVLDRVNVDVIQVHYEVTPVFDRVFPESLFPHGAVSLAVSALGGCALVAAICQPARGEAFLDLADAEGVIGVAGREGDEHVNVVREEDNGIGHERPEGSFLVDRGLEQFAAKGRAENSPALVRGHDDEIRSAVLPPASIIGHTLTCAKF